MSKYEYLWIVQGNYGQGWEDLTAGVWRDMKADLKAYRENDNTGIFRLIQRRILRT